MSEIETAFCRLCAQSKPYAKLVNLKTEVDRQIVVEKLSRLSLEVVHLDSPDDALPKTICFPCIKSLYRAIEFVSTVEASQVELRAYNLVKVKEEVVNDEVNDHVESFRKCMVKIEVEIGEELTFDDDIITDEHNTNDCDVNKHNSEELEESKINSPSTHENKTSNDSGLTKHNSVILYKSEINKPDYEINTNNEILKVDSVTEETKKDSVKQILIIESNLSWKEYSWLCAYCDVMFSSIDELKAHSILLHGSCNPYRCTDCKMRKLNLDGFITHINRHRNNLKLSCYRCYKTFKRQYDVIVHKKEHIATEFKCPGCNETFETKEQYLEHCNKYKKDKKIRVVPPEHITDDLKCVVCHKQFSDKGGLTTHLLTQHREQKRDHTCDKCGKCFLNKANLAGHMLMHDDIRPYQCDICKHCFRQRSQLSRHMGTHDSKKPFTCDKCGRSFRLKKQLSTHSIVHTDVNPYICSYCKKGFKHKSTFIQHVRLHTGERPYKCHVCHQDFTNWPNYNKHMKRRHGLNMVKSQQPPEDATTTKLLEIEVPMQTEPTDLSMQSKNNFIPKRRGRPKSVKGIKKKIPCRQIKSEVI